jgi:hypothetical protein
MSDLIAVSLFGNGLPSLPDLVRTGSGVEFDPRLVHWLYRDGTLDISLNFGLLPPVSPQFLLAFKWSLIWYARHKSPSHTKNMFVETKALLEHVYLRTKVLLSGISEVDILNYHASLREQDRYRLGMAKGFLLKWHEFGYPGIGRDAAGILKQLRLA